MSWTRSQIRVRGAGGRERPSGPLRNWPSSSTGWPASFTGRPTSSIGWPSLARSGKPRESIRGSPVGWGQEPVVKVWPQKWKASDSPGSINVPTVRAAVSAISAPPTRARKPRRELSRASESVMRSRCSGTGCLFPPCRRRKHAFELGQIVERPLCEHRALPIEGEREGTAWDLEVPPELRLDHLVEDADRDARVLGHVLDRRREGLADSAALGGEDGEPVVRPVLADPPREPGRGGADVRSLAPHLDRALGAEL